MEIILYLLRSANEIVLQFLRITWQSEKSKTFARWKVAMILFAHICLFGIDVNFADMFVQQTQFLFKTFTLETRLVVIYVCLEVTHWVH